MESKKQNFSSNVLKFITNMILMVEVLNCSLRERRVIMAMDMQMLIGTGEEDEEGGMEMDVTEEDDDDESGEKLSHATATTVMLGIDGVMPTSSGNNNHRLQQRQQIQEAGTLGGGGARKGRPLEEKERTKLRERHRRAITARILAGLWRHGSYNLRVRADINDVIAALTREAGWVVLPNGTAYPSRSQPQGSGHTGALVANLSSLHVVQQQTPPVSLRGVATGYQSSVEYNDCRMKGVYMPSSSPYDITIGAGSQTSTMVGEGREQTESHPLIDGFTIPLMTSS